VIRELLGRWRFMREHRWTQQHLSEYLDAELAGADVARLEGHVELCPQCRRILGTLRRTLESLRSLGSEQPAGAADAVIERLRKEG
jgi:predicted anti-sigma-YlaC factor YlaD